MKKNYIAVDFIPDHNWVFGKCFKESVSDKTAEWIIDGHDNCGKRKNKLSEVIRYSKYFAVGLKYFIIRKNVNMLLAYQQFYGIIFAYLCNLFHVKKSFKLVVMTFIYNPKNGKIGKVYDKFIRYAVESDYIDKIICFSKTECEEYKKYFNTNANKFTYTLLGKAGHRLSADVNESSYIVSAGRSNRDYKFLIESLKDTDYQVKIVSDTVPTELKNGLPSNIEVLENCFGKDYLEVLIHAKLVVIPLENEVISSGQLVLIQAMEAGIPVIVLGTKAMDDYIESGRNGFLLEKDKEALLDLVERLYGDKRYYESIANCARTAYSEKHTVEAMAGNIANIVAEIG